MDINTIRPSEEPRGPRDPQLLDGQRVVDGAARRQGDAQAPRAGGPLAAGRDESHWAGLNLAQRDARERLARMRDAVLRVEYRAHLPGDVKFELEFDPKTLAARLVVRRKVDGGAVRELSLEEIERFASGESDVSGLFLDEKL